MLLLESQGIDELRLLDQSVGPQTCIRNLERQQSTKGGRTGSVPIDPKT